MAVSLSPDNPSRVRVKMSASHNRIYGITETTTHYSRGLGTCRRYPSQPLSAAMDVDEIQCAKQIPTQLASEQNGDVADGNTRAMLISQQLPALPRFPLPKQPEAPSPAVLYLQGVDEALIEAEVVDPARTIPFFANDQEDASGLSLKARQRLSQLGISELFAGMSSHCVLSHMSCWHCLST